MVTKGRILSKHVVYVFGNVTLNLHFIQSISIIKIFGEQGTVLIFN